MSLAKLVQRFKEGFADEPGVPHHPPLHLATAAVLLEIANADGELKPVEDGNIAGYLGKAFGLDDASIRELIQAAEEERSSTIDHFSLTHQIRRHASFEDRLDIVRTMWHIVYSDGRLSDYENYLVRKLADLLGIERHRMIEEKVRVLDELHGKER